MQISYPTVQAYSGLLNEVQSRGVADLDRLLASLVGVSDREKFAALMDMLPELGNSYLGAASVVSANFFDELQELQEVKKPVMAELVKDLDRGSWQALVGWGANGARSPGRTIAGGIANDLFFSLLSGGFTRRLTEGAADTMIGNAAAQGSMRYQRVPSAGCCDFCAMLASRGNVYHSKESAGGVVGRGQSVEYGKRGGAKEIRSRGSRSVGEAFHDNCRCRVVAVAEGNTVDLGRQAEDYFSRYMEARDKVNDSLEFASDSWMSPNGDRHSETYRLDAEGDRVSSKDVTNKITAEMRKAAAA